MHNYFSHKKAQILRQGQSQQKHIRKKQKQIHILNYQEKAIQKISSCHNKPIKTTSGKPSPIQRFSDHQKNVGPPAFYFQHKSSRDRVENQINNNKCLDSIPFSMDARNKFRESKNINSFSQLSQKKVFPSLAPKRYPHSYTTVQNHIPFGVLSAIENRIQINSSEKNI